MGLDAVLYSDGGKYIGIYEISQGLHDAIFNDAGMWGSYFQLRRFSDFYVGKIVYEKDALARLRQDIEAYRQFITHQGTYPAPWGVCLFWK